MEREDVTENHALGTGRKVMAHSGVVVRNEMGLNQRTWQHILPADKRVGPELRGRWTRVCTAVRGEGPE